MAVDSIVVSYRTKGDLMNFLDSWEKHGDGGKLWVINVDPLPEHDDIGRHIDNPDIEYLPLDYNAGYARSVNLGASKGSAPVLSAFNADCILTPGVLEACERALLDNDDWGVLGPRQLDLSGRVTHGGIFGTNTEPKFRGWQSPDRLEFHDVREAVTVSGSAYFVKRSVWDLLHRCPIYSGSYPQALGAFLPTPHYYEETFCSYHSRAHGYKVIYYGVVDMIHKWHTASTVGGWAEQQLPVSQKMFREMCDLHGIEHD